jgi:hypothetical protein
MPAIKKNKPETVVAVDDGVFSEWMTSDGDENSFDDSIHGALIKKGVKYQLRHQTSLHKSYKVLTLKNKVRLSDIFLKMPYGIVDKQITGIGATTLELNAKRNSIIVEPLKAIAYSKAMTNPDYFYVGSKIGSIKSDVEELDIKNYIAKSKILYKKILVVSDSLPKVIQAIGEEVFLTYFLMIDEVDSFQADSHFRAKMELCLDIYKIFNREKRNMVTATMLPFSDPYLKDEKVIEINFEFPEKRYINLIYTRTIQDTTAFKISELHKSNPDQKIFIAYNSINEPLNIIRILTEHFKIDKSVLKIACSVASKKKAGDLFIELSNDNLSGTIFFLTSAYFTGVDIEECFHCISVSDGQIPNTLLSEHRLKQIAGRCRKELYSETVIYSIYQRDESPYEKLDEDGLLKIANLQLEGLKCLEKQYKKDEILKKELIKVMQAYIDAENHRGLSFIRTDKNKELKISYFNIDACLEINRVKQKLYMNNKQLPNALESNNYTVSYEEIDKDYDIFKGKNNQTDQEIIEDVVDQLLTMTDNDKRVLYDLKYECGSSLGSRIIDQYMELMPYLDKNLLLEKIKELAPKNLTHYKNFKNSVLFEAAGEDIEWWIFRSIVHQHSAAYYRSNSGA